MKKLPVAAAGFAALAITHAFAQTACRGTTLTGRVQDSTLALIPGATLRLDNGRNEVSGSDGRFRFQCVDKGTHHLIAKADGFAEHDFAVTSPHMGQLDLVLEPAEVETELSVSAEDSAETSSTASGPTETISGSQLQMLADDPDDLLRELQQLSAVSGGDPANATITVDGFQGSTSLPPKSSIAYIKVNPDLYSAEYRQPPFGGGTIEVYTKPGQKSYHGALFLTNSNPWENARDPFSTSKAPLSKQRYGFELGGPVRKTGSDFALTLEHRSIDNFAVVNAITLDDAGNTVNTVANVAAPQRLWLGTSRLDWQLGAKNTFIASYNATVNYLGNFGVGGSALAETGSDREKYDHIFRLSDVTTASAHFMHESRLSLRWDGQIDTPVSTAPQVQVAGAFTGGGATLGPQHLREFNVEVDDDAILTTKSHTLKFGTQLLIFDEHHDMTSSFNGTYVFGGGSAPVLDAGGNTINGQTETITGIEQYRRAQLGLPGGTPTAFSNVVGTPKVSFTLTQGVLFVQDDWNAGHGVHFAYGLRYALQDNPVMLDGLTPRAGILWSPDKKNRWTLHAHAGMFSGSLLPNITAEVFREDGTARITSTIYNPVYGNPFSSGATVIHSRREFYPHLSNLLFAIENIGGTRALPYGWNLSVDYYVGRLWNDGRTENINSPLNGSPTGPRPGAPNLNVLQVQNSGQGRANLVFLGLEQHKLKHLQLSLGTLRLDVVDNTNDYPFFTPQSSATDAGEFAHRTNDPTWIVFGNGMVTLPYKMQLSANLNAHSGNHYNVTTGFDNNGDGNFNDRPQYAAPGTPGAIATQFGLLVPTGGSGVFPRNKGTMPWGIYLDTNLQRAFVLTRNAKAEHQQTITVNLRASNVLNHLNVTQVGGVLGSPLFGVPYAADNGRRVEAGLRYSF